MIIITNPVTQNNDLTWVLTTVDLAIQEVTEIIHGLEENPIQVDKTAKNTTAKKPAAKTAIKSPTNAAKAELPKETPKGSNGSAKKGTKTATKKSQAENKELESNPEEENDVHDFWKAATLEEEITRIDSPDSLSFEQAKKLGFIPGGDAL